MFYQFDLFITDRSINNRFPFCTIILANGYARYANEVRAVGCGWVCAAHSEMFGHR